MNIGKASLHLAVYACALISGEAGLAQSGATAAPQLYENIEVRGVMECKIKSDIHVIVGTKQFLRCDYTPQEGVDVLKRYSGYVKSLKEGFSFQDGDFICWSVLYLRHVDAPADWADPIKGAYSTAAASVTQQYELKENALVGGANKAFALEPRCVAPERAGRNIADVVTGFELSR